MRTTVTLDADVEALLRKAMREKDEPFKQVLNAAIREGLTSPRRKPAKPFKQPTFNMGEALVDLTKALSLAAELGDAETIAKMQRRRQRR
ncbi:MAG: antitoxin [Betaproteobacteria bacterium]|nr:antitoxin [Betaproteobacteria bacterium]MBA3774983.1 antitoxin [Betaproteobacteria bacterium]